MTPRSRKWWLTTLTLATALLAWWLRRPPPPADRAPSAVAADPPRPSRSSANQPRPLAGPPSAPAERADVVDLSLPSRLPALDAAIAPPLPADTPPPPPVPLASAVATGQVSASDARNAGEAIWPAIAPCLAGWKGDVALHLGLAGGEPPGSSRLYEPSITTAGVPAAMQACVASHLADLTVAVATDTNGAVDLTYRP